MELVLTGTMTTTESWGNREEVITGNQEMPAPEISDEASRSTSP